MPTATNLEMVMEDNSLTSPSSRREGRNVPEEFRRGKGRLVERGSGEIEEEGISRDCRDSSWKPTRRKTRSSTSSKSKKQSSRSKQRSDKSHREPDGSPHYHRMLKSPPRPEGDNDYASDRSRKSEALVAELMDQLTALKVQNANLEEDLVVTKEALDEERTDMQELEEENLEMQHDLAETRRVRDRLERENHVLTKKLIEREAENNRLQDKLDNLTGVTGDESVVGRYESHRLEEETTNVRRGLQVSEHSRQSLSLWSLLAEETISEEHQLDDAPVSPSESKKGVFDTFFGSSTSSPMFNGSFSRSLSSMSVRTNSSSHSRKPTNRSPGRGGFVSAA